MAFKGKHNVLQLVRVNKAPYWRLYHSDVKDRQAILLMEQIFLMLASTLKRPLKDCAGHWTALPRGCMF
jgi:hypothetical protein